jgi:hypothetical protein
MQIALLNGHTANFVRHLPPKLVGMSFYISHANTVLITVCVSRRNPTCTPQGTSRQGPLRGSRLDTTNEGTSPSNAD